MNSINVHLASNSYSIVIEPGSLERIGEHVRSLAPHAKCLLAMDANIAAPNAPHGELALASLRNAGFEVTVAPVLAEESHKTQASVDALHRAMLVARLERKSPVIALGGGITGDVAGFAAATYLRGVPLIHVPTTLLAMVDAAIGGKTGINVPLPESSSLGKNLIGAIWQPKTVLIDPRTLATLNDRDFRCGLGECIKHAMIADANHLTWLYDNAEAIAARDVPMLIEVIRISAAIKARIVSADEREDGQRALLNLGHTFAHAIESIHELSHKHGEAVALGLIAACDTAVRLQRMTDHQRDLVIQTISRCGLPQQMNQAVSAIRLMQAMQFDKKVMDGRVRLIVPRGIGCAEIVDDVPDDVVRDAWKAIGATV